MNLPQKIRLFLSRRSMRLVIGVLVFAYLGTGFFCHCLAIPTVRHSHYAQQQTQQPAQKSADCHHNADRPSGDPTSAPHACTCAGMHQAVLVSGAALESVTPLQSLVLIAAVVARVYEAPLQHRVAVDVHHHGPPAHVPIHLQNQVFLI